MSKVAFIGFGSEPTLSMTVLSANYALQRAGARQLRMSRVEQAIEINQLRSASELALVAERDC
jgi:hypothetical protein